MAVGDPCYLVLFRRDPDERPDGYVHARHVLWFAGTSFWRFVEAGVADRAIDRRVMLPGYADELEPGTMGLPLAELVKVAPPEDGSDAAAWAFLDALAADDDGRAPWWAAMMPLEGPP